MIDEKRLAEIEARHTAAVKASRSSRWTTRWEEIAHIYSTPPKKAWACMVPEIGSSVALDHVDLEQTRRPKLPGPRADFIANTVVDIPELLAEVRRLQSEMVSPEACALLLEAVKNECRLKEEWKATAARYEAVLEYIASHGGAWEAGQAKAALGLPV